MDLHREFFEKLADDWDSQQHGNRFQHLSRLINTVVPSLENCKKLINIGSGTGFLPTILNQFYPCVEVISIDLAFTMLQKNHQMDPSAIIMQADVHSLPLPAQFADAIICHNSFPHFQNHPLAVQEMRRVLKDGHLLVILHDINREQVNTVHRNATEQVIHHDMLPDPVRLAGLLEMCGLNNIEISEGTDYFLAVGRK